MVLNDFVRECVIPYLYIYIYKRLSIYWKDFFFNGKDFDVKGLCSKLQT